uniref:Uncharacterized protein n=1 Tax=Odontella aurita TaxID=265563 RepID=A0A7S4MUL1_9STRA
MAACQAPHRMTSLPMSNGGGAAVAGIHPLIAIRLRMQQGRHKHATPVGCGTIPRTISIVPSPPLADGDDGPCSAEAASAGFLTPRAAAHPRSLSPPPTPGRPRRHPKRSQVDISGYPEFIPAGKLSRSTKMNKAMAHSQMTKKPDLPKSLPNPAQQRPTTPFRPEPRFDCSWLRRVDADMGGGSDEEHEARLPSIPFAPFQFDEPVKPSAPPPRMTEMTLKPLSIPGPPPLSGSSPSPEVVSRKMSDMNLSGSMRAASGGTKFQKRAGRTNINARCA